MTETNLPTGSEHFRFACPTCRRTVDTALAAWCLCLVKRPSLVCNRCKHCLCAAEPQVVREFWNRAPASLRARNDAECKRRAVRTYDPGADTDILIVDDDEEIRAIAAFMLEKMGYRVLTAPDAATTFELMKTIRPALILTDALMPKTDGRQLCRTIKADFPGVLVVIMTSLYTSTRYKYEALKVFGADDYLAKPIDFDRLRESIGKLLPRLARAAA
jgi:CheY-like chemotaxis protein